MEKAAHWDLGDRNAFGEMVRNGFEKWETAILTANFENFDISVFPRNENFPFLKNKKVLKR